jgi:hypothetical protein
VCCLLHYDSFMQAEHDESIFNWIRRGRAEPKRDNEVRHAVGYFLSLLMSPAFGAYAKILHRIEAHYEIVDILSPRARLPFLESRDVKN